MKQRRRYARRRRKTSFLTKAQKAYIVGKAVRQRYLNYKARQKEKHAKKLQEEIEAKASYASFLEHKEKYEKARKQSLFGGDYTI